MLLSKHRKTRYFFLLGAGIFFLAFLWTISLFYTKKSLENYFISLQEQGMLVDHERLVIEKFFPFFTFSIKTITLKNIPISKKNSACLDIHNLELSALPLFPKKISGAFEKTQVYFSQNPWEVVLGPCFFEIFLSPESFQGKGTIDALTLHTNKGGRIHVEKISLSISPKTLQAQTNQDPYEISGMRVESAFQKLSLRQFFSEKDFSFENFTCTVFLMEKIRLWDALKKSLKEILLEWRDQGGAMDIDCFSFSTQNLYVNLQGTLSLDETSNPEGAFTLFIKGIPDFLKKISSNQTYSLQDRLFLELSLGFLKGASQEITFPVTLQNQTVRLGNFINLTLPPLDW